MEDIQSFEHKEIKINYSLLIVGFLLLSVFLTYLIRSGFPKGIIFLGFAFLLMVVIFLRAEYGIITLFIYIVFITYFRRLFYFSVGDVETFDILVVLPEIGIALLFIRILIDIVVFKKEIYWKNNLTRKIDTVDLWIIIILIYQFLEIFNPALKSPITGVLGFRSFGIYFFLYFAAKQYLNTPEKVNTLVNIIIISSFVVGIYGIKQMLFGFNAGEQIFILSGKLSSLTVSYSIRRIFATMNSPLHAGAIFIIGSIFSFNKLQLSKTLKEKIWYGTILGTLIFANIGTIQRTNWVGMVIVFLFYFLLQPGLLKKLNFKMLASFVVILIISLIIVSKINIQRGTVEYRPYALFVEKFGSMRTPEKVGSFKVRMEVWGNLKEIIFTRPFGFGLFTSKIEGEVSYGTDNAYFSILLRNGVVGLLIFLAGFILIALQMIQIYKMTLDQEFRLFIIIYISIIFAILAMGIASVSHNLQPFTFMLFIGLGIVMNHKSITEEKSTTMIPGSTGVYFSRYYR